MDWKSFIEVLKMAGVGGTILLMFGGTAYFIVRIVMNYMTNTLDKYTDQGTSQNNEIVKHLIVQNDKYDERMTERDRIFESRMAERDEKHERRMKNQEESFAKALDKNSEAVEKNSGAIGKLVETHARIYETLGTKAQGIAENSLISHESIIKKVDSLFPELRGVKAEVKIVGTTVTSLHDHLVARMNTLEDDWSKTRDMIRACSGYNSEKK